MDIYDFSTAVAGGEETVLKYFQDHGLIRHDAQCQPCGRAYTQVKKK